MLNVPIRVRDALKDGRYGKNYRIIVLDENNDEDFTIDNENLVEESVSIEERMCSGEDLVFGLCEGSSIEFQYFEKPNIRGRRINVFVDVEYFDGTENAIYPIPMGFYDIQQCSKQFDTGIIKATGYNKLRSEYLDVQANDLIYELTQDLDRETLSVSDIISNLLNGYSIEKLEPTVIAPITSERDWTDGYVRSFRFSNLYGNQGILSPFILPNPSTSSTYYMYMSSYVWDYVPEDESPVKIKGNGHDLDALDQTFYDYIYNSISMLKLNVDADTLMNNIVNATKASDDEWNKDFYGWCNKIRIYYKDGTFDTYSKIAFESGEADGTFETMSRLTFKNVDFIRLYSPRYMILSTVKYTSRSEIPVYAKIIGLYTVSSMNDITNSRVGGVYRESGDNTDLLHLQDGLYDENGEWIEWGNVTPFYSIATYPGIDEFEQTDLDGTNLPDVTLRDLQSAVYELKAQFGQLDRQTDLFSGVTLNHERLYPSDTLYPSNMLYPKSTAERAAPAMYQKLWTDDGLIKKFRTLYITYKGLDDENREVEKILERQINADGNTDYRMSSNWLFNNVVWTAEQVGTFADEMVDKLRDVTWIPFEMWSAGLPYLETGDEIEIKTNDGTVTSYILSRTLNGIQNLEDAYVNGTLDIF